MADAVEMQKPVTVVTGASYGIGRELALLAARDAEVLLVARGAEGLAAVAAEIAARGGRATCLASDLSLQGAVGSLMAQMEALGLRCNRLVNNAGFGFIGPAAALDVGEQLSSIDVNVRALTELTLAVLPDMIRRGEGGILNVGSIAGFMAGPNSAVYYATKAYVHSFTEAIRAEVAGTGVRVTLLCPGPVNTGFLKRATGGLRQAEASVFHIPAAEVAEAGWSGLKEGRAVIVPGLANRLVELAAWILPRSVLSALVLRRQRDRTTT